MGDKIKWLLIMVLAALGASGHYMYSSIPSSQIALGWVVLGSVLLGLMATTTSGQLFMGFAKDAEVELRKVIWPTRQETVETAFIVLGIVLVTGIILWVMDATLLHVVGVITGQKG